MIVANRETLLTALDTVAPGLSRKERYEQSACFAFFSGLITTHNDEICCRAKSPLPASFTGAVDAKPLTDLLREMTEEEVTLIPDTDKVTVKGKGKRYKIAFHKKVLLDTSSVEEPETWKKLSPHFADAVAVVAECAAKGQTPYLPNCVHLDPTFMQACDNRQIGHYVLKTRVSGPLLVRRDSLKHTVPLGMVEVAETENWLHFRNEDGLTMSVRCDRSNPYPDTGGWLADDEGRTPLVFPKALIETAKRLDIAASQVKDGKVLVRLKAGEITLEGVGLTVSGEERKWIDYKGPDREFTISPTLLSRVVESHSECEVSDRKLTIREGRCTVVVALGNPKKPEIKEQE